MRDIILITGHKNPDSDSICSALAYAALKQQLGVSAIACRLGPVNEETKYILKRFDVEVPFVLTDARAQLRDIQIDAPTLIPTSTSVADAWNILYTVKNKSLFVVDENEKLVGVVSTSNLSSPRLMNDEELENLMAHATIESIAKTCKGEIIYRPEECKTNGKVFIVTLINDQSFQTQFKDSIVILSDGDEKQHQIIESGAKCLVITCKQQVSEENCKLAKEKGCAIIHTHLDTMQVARFINESFPVEFIMTHNPKTCLDTEYVNDVSHKIAKTRYRSYPVVNEFGKVVGGVSRYHLNNYEPRKFILVDHSAKNQSINNIDQAHIEEIIDHHHIGNIETTYPIFYRNQKCGCTCTIVAQMYQENRIAPTRQMAGLMLGAIISDTMHFRSLTTTQLDKDTAEYLAAIAGVDIKEFAMGLLSASIALKESTPEDILNRDLKTYEIGKYKIGIGQTNFKNMEDIQIILPTFRPYLGKVQEEKNYDLLIMMFSNINAEGSMFVFSGPLSNVLNGLIEKRIDENTGFDPLIISRKQQFVPKLSALLKNM